MSMDSRTVSLPTTARTAFLEPETTKCSPSLWPAGTGSQAIGSRPEIAAVNALASMIEPLHRLPPLGSSPHSARMKGLISGATTRTAAQVNN
jgi:hypothetical protein